VERTATKDLSVKARRAGNSKWFDWAGRFGLAAQGVSYAIVAVLALLLAGGLGGKTADRTGALRSLADEPLGGALLVLVAVGFAAYAAWRFAAAFFDRDDDGDDAKGLGKRAGDFAKGVFYGVLTISVVRILFGADEGGEKDADQKTAGVLGWPAGRWIVFAVALGVAVAAVWNVYRGVSRKFEDDLEVGTSHNVRCWIGRIGLVGLVARGVAFAIIAWFLAKAAWEFDPKEAVSLGGALAKLVSAPAGHAVLAVVAAGLLAFALFCLAQARYRDV
jgi:Domain of Unknown Function (DUF1206)